MRLTFVSNYINHHQLPFCNACMELTGGDFTFIQTMPMEQERINMGWDTSISSLSYVHCLYSEEAECKKIIEESDVILLGWTAMPELDRELLSKGRIVIRISERIYREGQWKMFSPRGLAAKYREHIKYRNEKVYLLCSGAYTASDFSLIHSYPGKMYKWGYFPQTRFYTDDELRNAKVHDGPLKIAWAGRMIDLKHPEFAIRAAKKLNDENIDFRLSMAGDGNLLAAMKQMAASEGIADKVRFYGALPPDEIRTIMEDAQIFLFTSNYLEGWGAVVNEAMNSGCALVASAQAGSVPFLIRDGQNGLTYDNGSYSEFEEKVLYLEANPAKRYDMGCKAYRTITMTWNAENAARRLLSFCGAVIEGREFAPPDDGPMSKAVVIKPQTGCR